MNKEIYGILNKINKKGYEAYVVGGYVRDFLLGIVSNDIDICSNIPFEECKKLFPHSNLFELYNCIKFTINNNFYSITIYRKENGYINNKPSVIEFSNDLETDLKRRDYTINSICLNKENEIIDLLGGVADIKKKVIRSIGDIRQKLTEDSTRILRALKYMSKLNFKLEPELENYIIENKKLILNIPINRVKSELDSIFQSKNYPIFLNYIKNNNLEDVFGIHVHDIIKSDNYLDIWKSLIINKEYPFTKEEKKYIFNK